MRHFWAGALSLALVAACSTAEAEPEPEPSYDQIVAAWADTGLSNDAAGCVVELIPDSLSATEQLEAASMPAEFEDLVAACEEATAPAEVTTTTRRSSNDPFTYGDDAMLDRLWDQCGEGSGAACDELFNEAPAESEYERFGLSCGDRPEVLNCDELDGSTTTVADESG